ncbi:MBOAT family O-acyltransferase [Algoriphagus halophilus]|uniref:MBOAT family O-acyltransferase n=1 Tax=Algoriphagus halophilus TaxID=226505 RepID=UPI00358F6D9F
MVAGPIERASHLLGQFQKPRIFDYSFAVSGLRLIIWGLFKKIVIADNAAFMVDEIFLDYTNQSSLSLILGVVLFAFQIYGDFSGYSDIAIGLSRIFGFDLMLNFRFPYLAQNINDFWKRWHISLSSWFRDYVYIPLGGSRVSTWVSFRNVLIVFW